MGMNNENEDENENENADENGVESYLYNNYYNISYHIVPYRTMPYHAVLYHTTSPPSLLPPTAFQKPEQQQHRPITEQTIPSVPAALHARTYTHVTQLCRSPSVREGSTV